MNIIVTHSSKFDFKNEVYKPIRESALNTEHHFYLPQEKAEEGITKEMIQNADLLFAEVSYPSTGQGIELGWADIFKTPIVCFYQSGKTPSNSIKYVSKNWIEYADGPDLIEKLSNFLNAPHA
jgi:hypothetical protein